MLLCTLTLACTPRPMPGRIDSYVVDFSPFKDRGFLFTPESYNGDYDGVGLIEIVFRPPVTVTRTSDGGFWGGSGLKYETETVDMESALEELYNRASSMGSDAVVNFRMRYVSVLTGQRYFDSLVLSGFAIKRKGAF